MIATPRSRLSADDFFTGFFAALTMKRCKTVSRQGQTFDSALADTFDTFQKHAKELDIDLGFRIRLNPIHHDSVVVRDGIAGAARRDLVSLDNPIYQNIRLKLSEEEARKLLERLPGGQELFAGLVEQFFDVYEKRG
jgi:capsid protein